MDTVFDGKLFDSLEKPTKVPSMFLDFFKDFKLHVLLIFFINVLITISLYLSAFSLLAFFLHDSSLTWFLFLFLLCRVLFIEI